MVPKKSAVNDIRATTDMIDDGSFTSTRVERSVSESQGAVIDVGGVAFVSGGIFRESAGLDSRDPTVVINSAPAAPAILRYRRVTYRHRDRVSEVVNAAAISRRIAIDGAVAKGKRTVIVKYAAPIDRRTR